ncbi:hypothetical protein DPMN_004329 [Dreissena polymorpha]|uniref:Uncharacterized protein n=1 Tax=Dreissena polymorpha TaxID=45954 RepID=A0A9D4MNA4_DREPO|nr:hypothetical protein DPMN_004329 [Dreissena polymorpha]
MNKEVEKYFEEIITICHKNNNLSSTEERELLFKTVHRIRTDKEIVSKGVILIQSSVKAQSAKDINNFLQIIILELIAEVIKARRQLEEKTSAAKVSEISDSDNKVLYYISGYIIKYLEKKHSKQKNKQLRDRSLKTVSALTNSSGAVSFTDKFSVWYDKKNRGGLKMPCEDFFCMIREFERVVRENQYTEHNIASKEEIKGKVLEAFMIQHYADKLFYSEFSSEEDVSDMCFLEDCLEIFLTIRGFAMARAIQRTISRGKIFDKSAPSKSLKGSLKSISADQLSRN